ncbi:MAG: hypothetical protein QOJ64_3065, partial [Acidobacteriota bacterium]|nr:hypothetical protein [Acidobacteriota bacterium]
MIFSDDRPNGPRQEATEFFRRAYEAQQVED